MLTEIPRILLLIESSDGFGRRILEGVGSYVRQHGPWSLYCEARGLEDQVPPWFGRWRGYYIPLKNPNMKTLHFTLSLAASILFLSLVASLHAAEPVRVPVSELTPLSAEQSWGSLEPDRSVQGQALKIGGREFARGLGTHANSRVVYDLGGRCSRFEAWVGVDAEMAAYKEPSVVFQVFGDGKKLFDSGVMRIDTPARRAGADLRGVKQLALVVTDAGDGINCDHADWADATLVCDAALPRGTAPFVADRSPQYEIRAKALAVKLSGNGEIVSATLGGRETALAAWTRIGGCLQTGPAKAAMLAAGGMEFTRTLQSIASGRTLTLTDRFLPAGDSLRWEIAVLCDGGPWTADIATELDYPATAATRFWTAWSDPEHLGGPWRDPLAWQPLSSRAWTFGGRMTSGDYTAIPLATLAEPAKDVGVSIVFSPEDSILAGSRLTTTPAGAVRFSRANYRLGGGKAVCFAMDLTAHAADWRGGLHWLAARYPQCFDPPNPTVDLMAGCGAYSGDENPIDAARLKKMAFRVNWKLSDDFPYMGMFIPPVKDADEKWDRSCDEWAPANKPRWTSCRRLNDYAKYMKQSGFYVLNYFNVTEFGKNMGGLPAKKPGDPDLWKDPRAFLTTQLPGAILVGGNATCYAASAVDCGDPAFRKFILEQADRHNRLLPDSFGICIDRMDWLERSNGKADDGVTWIGGKPARSLCVSWNSLLARLGPKMHEADKVVFVNPIYSRLDLLRQVDGIYTEFGQDGRSLNSSALMGIRKPVLAWTYNETLRQPDPDSFMQRHLHLGVFPTAPYPGNNHCITPEPSADKLYLDYGPLLDALRGKKWVLQAHCVECTTPGVKVNLFEVPGGYVTPVTFGGKAKTAEVRLRNISGLDRLRLRGAASR